MSYNKCITLIILLMIICLSKEEERTFINVGDSFEEPLAHNTHYFTVSYNTIEAPFILIQVKSKVISNPAQIYVSKTNESPSTQFSDYKSIQSNENEIYIPKEYFNSEKKQFYITTICPFSNCDFSLNVNAATMITINKNEQYSFLTPENDYKQSIFYIPNKDNYEDNVVAYCVAGAQNEFIDVSLVYHKGNEEIENIPLNPMLYNGYITSFSELTYPIEKDNEKYEFKIKTKKNSYVSCGFRAMNNFRNPIIINTFANSEIYGYFESSMADKECFIIDNEQGVDDDSIIIDVIAFLHDVDLFILTKTTGVTTRRFTITTPSFITLSYSEMKNNYFCIKPTNYGDTISYSLQLINEDNNMNAQPYRLPIVNGLLKRAFLKSNAVTYHRRAKINNSSMKISLQSYSGNPILYGYTCKDYPNCYFDATTLEYMLKHETSETKLIFSHDVNKIYTLNGKSENQTMLSNEQYIAIVYCKGNSNCEYSISFFEDDDKVYLIADERHSDFLLKDHIDQFEFTLTNKFITQVEIALTVFNGDAIIESITQSPNKSKKEPKISYNGAKTVYLYVAETLGDDNDLLSTFLIRVKANTNTYFSIVHRPLYDDTEKIREVFAGVHSSQSIALKEQYRIFSLLNRDTKYNTPFISTFTPVNCKVSVKFEGVSISSENNNIIHIVNPSEPIYSTGIYSYTVQIDEMETKNSGDECKVLIGGKEQDYNKELLLLEGTPHSMTLIPGSFGQFSYLYPHHNTGGNVIININKNNNGVIKVEVSIEQSKSKTYLFSQSRAIIIKENELLSFCQKDFVCNIVISVMLIDMSVASNPISYEIIVRSKDLIPVYLQKNKLRNDVMNYDNVQYYFTDIGLNEVGEVLINFNRGSGKLFGKLVQKGTIEENPDYNGRIRLPKEDDANLLEYDPYTKKIYYNETVTNICVNGCDIFIGIKGEDQFINNSEEHLLDYSIFVRTQSEDKIVSFTPDKYIIGSLLKTISEAYFDYYTITIPYQADEVHIEFISDICTMYLNIRDDIVKPTQLEHDKEYNSTGYQIIILKEDVFLNKKITFSIGAHALDDVDTGYYSIKVSIKQSKEVRTIISLFSDQETLGIIQDNYSYYLLPIHDYDNAKRVQIYAKIEEEAVIYANIISMEEYDQLSDSEINNKLPSESAHNYSSEDNLQVNLLQIEPPDTFSNYYIIIGVYSLKDGSQIQLLASFRNYVKGFTLNPFSAQLLSFNSDKPLVTLNLPGDDNYLVEVTQLEGEGKITLNDKSFIVDSSFSNVGITVYKEDKNMTLERTNENRTLTCYVSYILRNGENYDELDFRKSNGIVYRNNKLPLTLYSKISTNNINDINVNFRFLQSISTSQLNVKGIIVNEEEIIKKKSNKAYLPSKTNEVKGYYNSQQNIGELLFSSDFIKNNTNSTLNNYYIYFVIYGEKENSTFTQTYLEVSPMTFVEGLLSLPLNKYYSGIANLNSLVNMYSIKRGETYQKFAMIDLITDDENARITIKTIKTDRDLKNDTHFNYEDNNSTFGKRSVVVNFHETNEKLKEFYIGVSSSKASSYLVRCKLGMDKNELESYIINEPKITIKYPYELRNNSVTISFTPVKNRKTMKIANGVYYFNVYFKRTLDLLSSSNINYLLVSNIIPPKFKYEYSISSEDTINECTLNLTNIYNNDSFTLVTLAKIIDNDYNELFAYDVLSNFTEYYYYPTPIGLQITFIIICCLFIIAIFILLIIFKHFDQLKCPFGNKKDDTVLLEENTILIP